MKKLRFSCTISMVLLYFLAMFPAMMNAQTRRALLIGINNYVSDKQTDKTKGSEWFNLDGCINDLDAMKSLLTIHYSFSDNNIIVLKEKDASRKNILNNLDLLAKETKKGDAVFIYYSGHGSQVRNSLSEEQDKLDEAIVPVDAAEGAPYIRDKELAPLFDRILDNGVMLPVSPDGYRGHKRSNTD